jgi:signal transduction histidine kinase
VLEHAFAERSGGEISIRTRRKGKDQVVLEFRDDGAGIDPAHLTKIFDPFFTTRLGQGGSGLGLNIVHNIVTGVLGGSITVDSQLARGTSFTLLIPVVAPKAPETPQA